MIMAVLQARMSSSRLPGKVLLPLAGRPMILRQIERVLRAGRIDRLVVATSLEASDDPLVAAVSGAGVAVHRGSLEDVLGRFTGALAAFPADHVVRLTGDCPLADPELIDATIAVHLETGSDYASNTPPQFAWPKGLDVEVITASALRRVAAEAKSSEAREHVTWDVWNQPDRYRLAWLPCPTDDGDVRWTVDRPDDYAFVSAVYEALHPHNPNFSSRDVRELLGRRRELQAWGGDRRL